MTCFPRLKPTLWDGVVAVCVVLLAVGILWTGGRGVGASDALTAVVFSDGAALDRVALRPDVREIRAYSGNGYALRVAFDPDGVQVLASDCPTQDCLHTGKITRNGQSIVCLPARIVIRLEGGASPAGAPDAVLG